MCQNCNDNDSLPHNVYNVQFAESSNCSATLNDCPNGIYSSKCTVYLGPNLPCTGVVTNDSMELALQKMDTAICANTGNYTTYNKHCLDAFFGSTITSEAEFVNAITNYTCTNKSLYDTFVGTTFPAYQADVTAALLAITQPAITCVAAGVTSADSLTTVLNKYCTAIDGLVTATTQFEVTWGSCFTEPTPPVTVAQGFQILVDQICQVKSNLTPALPVFNNGSNCLVGGTTSDTLEQTVNMIITRLCQTGTFDINALTWGNLTKPSSTATNLQAAFQTVLTDLSVVKGEVPTVWSGDFVVTATNPLDPAAGKTITLATPINQDRLVAATTGDTTPGTLQAKLYAGTNIDLDYVAHANQVTISAITNVLTTDTYSVHFTGDGSSASHISANVQISATAGNALSINTDGLFAAAAVVTPLTFVETDTILPTQTGANVYHNVKIDTAQAGNILQFSTNGLYVVSPSVLATIVTGGTTNSTITSVSTPISGTYAVISNVRLSVTANNFLSIQTDGLAAKVSSTAGNIISINADGIYASAGSAYTFDNGLTEAAGIVTLGGSLVQATLTATNTITTTGDNPFVLRSVLTDSAALALNSGAPVTAGAFNLQHVIAINRTIGISNVVTGLLSQYTPDITSGVTLTVSQTTIRAIAAHTAIFNLEANAPTTSTITHAAGIRTFLYAPNTTFYNAITNYYGLLIEDNKKYVNTSCITNTFAIYQEGTSDVSRFFGPVQNASGSVQFTSDARVKENITSFSRGLAEIDQIQTHNFNYTYNKEVNVTGVIAQELEAILPEAVSKGNFSTPGTETTQGTSFTDFRMVDQNVLFYTMLNAIKELSAKVKVLEAK